MGEKGKGWRFRGKREVVTKGNNKKKEGLWAEMDRRRVLGRD